MCAGAGSQATGGGVAGTTGTWSHSGGTAGTCDRTAAGVHRSAPWGVAAAIQRPPSGFSATEAAACGAATQASCAHHFPRGKSGARRRETQRPEWRVNPMRKDSDRERGGQKKSNEQM